MSLERQTAGQAVLALTDRVGFDAYAAAWVFDAESGAWRFVLSTPMLGLRGPEWVYSRLLRAFRRLEMPRGMSPLDVFVIDPAVEVAVFGEPDWPPARPAQGGPALTLGIPLRASGAFGEGVAYFYRRLPGRERGRDPSRDFDLLVRRLKAA